MINDISEKKKIAFVFPGCPNFPIGGYKVAFEYANRFAKDGYDVALIFPRLSGDSSSLFFRIKNFIGVYYRKFFNQIDVGTWYKFEKNVKKVIVPSFSDFFIKSLKDYKFITTAVQTSFWIAGLKTIPDDNKFYLIQDFEAWNEITPERVYESYRLPLKKIVIAPWLQREVEKAGSSAILIPNGFDFEYFKLMTKIENRVPFEVSMLYHLDDRKRCCDAIAALKLVKKKIPNLHVTAFGVPEKPDDLPDWFSYYQKPDKDLHNKIYNTAAIFVAASKAEGMALPPGESMICGCALVCTDIPGFALYAKDNNTALLSPVFDVEKLASNIIKVISNNELRIRLAKSGNEFIRQFTWEKAYSSFKEYISI